MAEKEKRTILDMRVAGKQYKEISAQLGIDISALKMFVHRQKHNDVKQCVQCKKVLPKDARKPQRFCSDKCRKRVTQPRVYIIPSQAVLSVVFELAALFFRKVRSAVSSYIAQGLMREYEVYDPYSKLNVVFVYRRDRIMDAAFLRFLETLQAHRR